MKKGHDICPLFFVSFNIKYHTLPYIMCKIYYTMKHSNSFDLYVLKKY